MTINELAKALSKFQSEVEPLKLTKSVKVTSQRTGATYNFKYADLAEVTSKIRKPLAENGLAYTQLITDKGVRTVLMHESGQYISGTTPLPSIPADPQQYGSLITYIKRYALVASLGLVAEEDDDANVASGNDFSFQKKGRPVTQLSTHLPEPADSTPTVKRCDQCGNTLTFKTGNRKSDGKAYQGWFCESGEKSHTVDFKWQAGVTNSNNQ